MTALDAAERAVAAGYAIAGYIAYDWTATLGVYEPPLGTTLTNSMNNVALSPPLPRLSRQEYTFAIAAIHEAIREGEVYQVNFTLPFDAAFGGDPFALYCKLALESRADYCVYVEDGACVIASLSPEVFLHIDGRRVCAKPMKGTSAPADEHELHQEKNRAEHVMIVDLLRNDLHRVCTDVTVEKLFTIERYPTLSTMTSTIAGTLPEQTTLAKLFDATFPCGSVTGAPKRAAMTHIGQFERWNRGAYTGTAGYLLPERKGWWNVAIRTLQLDPLAGTARLDTGGGIVWDSDADREWEEALLKTQFARPAFSGFACLETLRCGGAAPSDAAAHLHRLRSAAARFDIRFDATQLHKRLSDLNARRDTMLVRVRLALDGHIDIQPQPLDLPGERIALCLSKARVRSNDELLCYKTTWRPAHERAAAEALEAGCFDALLLNERGELTEGSRTNLFVRLDGRLYTPPLNCGVLPGILRAQMVDSGAALERALFEDDLRRADAVFAGNSARGLMEAEFRSTAAHV